MSELLASILEQAQDAILSMDTQGRVLSWNQAAERMFGRSERDALGQPAGTLAGGGWAAQFPDILDEVSTRRQIIRRDILFERADGVQVYVDIIAGPVRDEQGHPFAIAAITRDITERKRAEEELRQTQELSRRIIESSNDCIKVLDLDGRLLYMNPGGQKVLEICDLNDFLHTTWVDFWEGEYREAAVKAVARAKAGESDRFQGYCPTALGTPRWWNVVVTPITDPRGQIVQLLSVSRDITESRRAEEERAQLMREQAARAELETREQQFRTLANSMSQFAWIADHEGYIFWYNDRWYDYTGTTLEEMQGWGWQKVHHPDEVGRVVERIKVAFTTGEPWEDTFPLRSKDGEYRWFLSRALPIRDAEGHVVRWFGTNTDITEQLEMERALRESRDELEERVAERTAELSSANLVLEEEVAERQRVEEALLKQTKILESILSNMGDAVIVAGGDEKFLLFNPAAERMFGAGATETVSDEWPEQYGLYLPDKLTPFPADELPMSRSIRGEEVDDVEMFVRHENAPDGLWTRITGRPLRDSSGALSGGVIVCRDITERKKEEAFRAGQNRVLEMIATGDPLRDILDYLLLLVESQSEGLLCSVLMLDGDRVRHGAAPSLPEAYNKAVDGAPIGPKNGSCGTAMFTGKPVVVTDILTDPLWEDYRELAQLSGLRACWSTPLLSPEGKVHGSFAMYYREPRSPTAEDARLIDIATHLVGIAIEHQRAGDALRESRQKYASLINSVDGIVWELELASFEFTFVSQQAERILGYPAEQWLGDPNFRPDKLHPDDRSWAVDFYLAATERGEDHQFDYRMRAADGRFVWLHDIVTVVTEEGSPVRLRGIMVDITERRRAEDELRQMHGELARMSRVTALGELAASIAHEVNQPLAAIVGNADICLDWLAGDSPDMEQVREALADILADGNRAGEVIKRIRALVRKEAAPKTNLNVNEVVWEVMALVASAATRKRVMVRSKFASDLPEVMGDRVQLQQVLLNLMVNGMDAMSTVEDGNRELVVETGRDGADDVFVAVRDSGTGISAEDLEKVFGAFYTTKAEGMGMGLAISRSIIREHGGRLWAKANDGRGATFQFTLPVHN